MKPAPIPKAYVCSVLLLLSHITLAAPPVVELNLVPDARAPLNSTQDWARALARLSSVRVRAGGSLRAASPTIQRDDHSVRVTAIINSRNELLVPGKRFTLHQQSALENWLEQQRLGTPKSTTTELDRFGLTPEQLAQVHDSLKPIVSDSTLHQNVRHVVLAITEQIPLETRISPSVRGLLGAEQVHTELQGLSSGTVLAAVLDPLELALVPKLAKNGRVELEIVAQATATESWPIGWKPRQPVRDALPKLFDFLVIEINQTPIGDVLKALGGRLETPVVVDAPALAIQNIDLAETKVSFPRKRTFYSKVLSQTLFAARLDFEVRVDERGKPFLWITPLLRK